MVAGSLSETCVYTGKPECKEAVQEEFSKQFQPFIDNDVDFVVAEVTLHLFVFHTMVSLSYALILFKEL